MTADLGELERPISCDAMLVRDVNRFRRAGTRLAVAALHVIAESDGLHRLSLAVSEWARAVADEGDRAARSALPHPVGDKTP